MRNFEYHTPSTIEEASSLLSQFDQPQLLAGGQTLLPKLKQRLFAVSDVIKISALLPTHVEVTKNTVMIGAGITHATLCTCDLLLDYLPALANLAGEVGDPSVRHRGTLGGAIAVNDPSGDYPAAALALDASIHTNRRVITAEKFFIGPFETALEAGEIILQLVFKIPKHAHYNKILNPAARTPLVGVFAAELGGDPRIAVIGARELGVYRHQEFEAALASEFSSDAIKYIKTSPVGFLTSGHAGPAYRAALVDTLAASAIKAAGQTAD